MKRFLKTFALVIVSLFMLVSGVNVTLDQMNRSATKSSYTFYSEKDTVLIAYTGDLKSCPVYVRPGMGTPLISQHRT